MQTKDCAFDYVIVGAGSAGCVLANRLSEDGAARVLLLEAGGSDRDPLIHIPIGFGMIREKRLHDWQYDSDPEDGLADRKIPSYRGKVLGGSSSINVQVFTRGDRGDYDRWAGMGAAGWSWANVLPYFKRVESWAGGENKTRGGNGPVHVCWSDYPDSLFSAWTDAARGMGFRTDYDVNAGDVEGFGRVQLNVDRGRRASSNAAYLRPAAARPNLSVWTAAHALRLLFDGARATGVEVVRGRRTQKVFAEREVLLAAGAFNSPQLLMTSGIGPAAHLAALGIPVRADLPVGQGLQDHWSAPLFYVRRTPGPFHAGMRFDRLSLAMIEAYLLRRGPATKVPVNVLGFLRSSEHEPVPDLEFLLMPTSPTAKLWFPGWRKPYEDAIGIRPALLHGKSRGEVTLRSADLRVAPSIRFNALRETEDMRKLVKAMSFAREIARHPALNPYRGAEVMPGAAVTSDSDMESFIRRTATPLYHPASTCAIGRVVDPQLRVYGVDGLRVIDASVMPDLISGHTNACVMMIAEKASDMIRCQNASAAATSAAKRYRPAGHASDKAQIQPGRPA